MSRLTLRQQIERDVLAELGQCELAAGTARAFVTKTDLGDWHCEIREGGATVTLPFTTIGPIAGRLEAKGFTVSEAMR